MAFVGVALTVTDAPLSWLPVAGEMLPFAPADVVSLYCRMKLTLALRLPLIVSVHVLLVRDVPLR